MRLTITVLFIASILEAQTIASPDIEQYLDVTKSAVTSGKVNVTFHNIGQTSVNEVILYFTSTSKFTAFNWIYAPLLPGETITETVDSSVQLAAIITSSGRAVSSASIRVDQSILDAAFAYRIAASKEWNKWLELANTKSLQDFIAIAMQAPASDSPEGSVIALVRNRAMWIEASLKDGVSPTELRKTLILEISRYARNVEAGARRVAQ